MEDEVKRRREALLAEQRRADWAHAIIAVALTAIAIGIGVVIAEGAR